MSKKWKGRFRDFVIAYRWRLKIVKRIQTPNKDLELVK